MSAEWSAVLPFLLCALAFGLGVLLFPGPRVPADTRLADVIELAKFRRARQSGGSVAGR